MGKELTVIQADIIFKALYYVAEREKVEIPEECRTIYTVLAEQNPKETHAEDTIDVMDYLSSFIKNDDGYTEYFTEQLEDDD